MSNKKQTPLQQATPVPLSPVDVQEAAKLFVESLGWTDGAEHNDMVKSFLAGHAIKLEENKGQQGEQSLKGSVSEVLKESGGLWQACTGCHETVDGQETGHYPYNDTFQSYQGSGCHECGGIGVVWNDYSDYEQKISPAPSLPEGIVEQLIAANPNKWGGVDSSNYAKHIIWQQCCSKLRELIFSQSK